jgi:tetratricopeptide (TPR) repeat protein
VPLHLLQLQTAFDTIASYTLIGVVIGYGIWCEKQISLKSITVSSGKNLALAIAFIIVALISMKFMIFDENNRQIALTKAFQTENFNEQQKLIERSLSRTSDLEGLRLSARSFIKGVVESDLETANQKIFKERINLIASLYDDAYSKYLDSYPNHYRARINYAYFMLIEGTLGKNRIAEAKKLLEDSYILSPNNPLTYSIHAIAEFYDGNVEVARKRADEAVRLNQEIVPAKIIHEYIIEQEKTMPSISFLHIENL